MWICQQSSLNISPVRVLLEAVNFNEVHSQLAQPLIHVVILGAELAVLTKADNLKSKVDVNVWHLPHLEVWSHAGQSPMPDHMVLPLVDVLEAQELTLAAFQLAELATDKMIKACWRKYWYKNIETSSASGPSKSSLSSSILGAASSPISRLLTGSGTVIDCLYFVDAKVSAG